MRPVRRIAALALVLAASLAVAGCGFQPLYGDLGVSRNLAAIEVVAPEGRSGHLIRESLDDAFAVRPGTPPAYRMDLTLAEVRIPRGLRVDNVATRYEMTLTANYKLTELATGAVVKAGTAASTVTYDSADQPYASIAAQQDSQERAAAETARRLQLELAAWFAQRR